MHKHTPQFPDSQSKPCTNCKQVKPVSEFYIRPGGGNYYTSECKACMRVRSKSARYQSPTIPLVKSEVMAIETLSRNGIHAVPGKAITYANVDVVAFGCVRIEVKYSRLNRKTRRERYMFRATPSQVERGFLADIVMLICDDDKNVSYHLFPVDFDAFYIHGRLKNGFDFVPGAMFPAKHGDNRVVMTQPMMDAHRDNYALVWKTLKNISDGLRRTG